MKQVFDAYAQYYDLIYQDKDYSAEAEFIVQQIGENPKRGNRILELGCGTGAHAEQLARRGYFVHGIDLSEEMLAAAEARKAALPEELAARLSFGPGDVRSVRTYETYDVVISLFHVISYQSTNSDLRAVFETAAKHLSTTGIFLFDFWYGPAVLTQVPETRVKRLENNTIKVTRIAEPTSYVNENRVDVNYSIYIERKDNGKITEIKENHRMRYLFLPELDFYLDVDTWSDYRSSEWLNTTELSSDCWSGFVAATRK